MEIEKGETVRTRPKEIKATGIEAKGIEVRPPLDPVLANLKECVNSSWEHLPVDENGVPENDPKTGEPYVLSSENLKSWAKIQMLDSSHCIIRFDTKEIYRGGFYSERIFNDLTLDGYEIENSSIEEEWFSLKKKVKDD